MWCHGVLVCGVWSLSWCLVCGGLCSHLDSACSPTACGLLCGATCVVCLVCGVLISRVCGDSGILESRLTVPYNCQNRRFPKNGGPAVHPPWGHTIRWPPVGGAQRVRPEIKTPTQFCRCFTPLNPPERLRTFRRTSAESCVNSFFGSFFRI